MDQARALNTKPEARLQEDSEYSKVELRALKEAADWHVCSSKPFIQVHGNGAHGDMLSPDSLFDALDTNHDGVIDRAEFDAARLTGTGAPAIDAAMRQPISYLAASQNTLNSHPYRLASFNAPSPVEQAHKMSLDLGLHKLDAELEHTSRQGAVDHGLRVSDLCNTMNLSTHDALHRSSNNDTMHLSGNHDTLHRSNKVWSQCPCCLKIVV